MNLRRQQPERRKFERRRNGSRQNRLRFHERRRGDRRDSPPAAFSSDLDADTGVLIDAIELSSEAIQDHDTIEARRQALISMLDASESRFLDASKHRRPVLAAGHRIQVSSGPQVGKAGTIEDADYIESRVLIKFDDGSATEWIAFHRVGAH